MDYISVTPNTEDMEAQITHDSKGDYTYTHLPLHQSNGIHSKGKGHSFTHLLESGEDEEQVNVTEAKKQHVMVLNDTKAGMEGLDLERINKIITETSEGSKFFEHKRKAKERLDQRAREIRQQYDRLAPAAIKESERKIDKIALELEANKDDSRIIVHIDMDCFFAAVETRDNPKLSTEPMAVGSMSMLSTSNYIARKYGVRAAMPGFIAKKLCPNLIIIPCNFEKYSAASAIAHEVYKQYDTECYSMMDEASLDITEYMRNHVTDEEDEDITIEEIVNEIRKKVQIATNGLTCSAGISSNGFLSKICSDINKPNGQFRLKPSEVRDFVSQMRIRKVNGIGEATENLLSALDILTCGDIWERRGAINLLFKPATVDFLLRVSLGLGKHFFSSPTSTENTSSDDRKSISCERTFSETGNIEFLSELCQHLSSELSQDLISKDCKCKSVTVKIKTDKFDVKTRVRTLLDYTADADIIFKTAMSIFDSLREQEGMILRLLGVRLSFLKFKNQKVDEVGQNGPSTSQNLSTKQFWQKFMEPDVLFDCPICTKVFVNSFSLRKHVEECLDQAEAKSLTTEAIDDNAKPSNSNIRMKRDESEAKKEQNQQESNETKCKSPKRLKMLVENARNTKPSTSNSSKSSKGNQSDKMKMMPINFYFQNQQKKDAL